MKKRFLIPVSLLFAFLLFGLGGFVWWKENTKPVSSTASAVRFVIPKGRSAAEIGSELYKQGLIRNPLTFKVYLQLMGKTKTVQAGEFKLSPSLSLPEIVDALYKGPLEIWVTIPEGLRREEVVEKFVTGLELQGDSATAFRSDFLTASKNKEGYLFPSTYLFPRDVSSGKVVDTLTQTFQRKLDEAKAGKISQNNLSLEDTVTLASLIERETKTDTERPVVAGILLNRLRIGMALQVDATVQYALANLQLTTNNLQPKSWWPTVLLNDLEITSPYNTYKQTGLPPAPIANPGASSLSAALFPEENNYFYYIHDPSGQIHYAVTLSEHNANVRKYLGR
jgi:UPF0755 protein